METKAKDWKGLDKLGSVFESTDWENGAEGLLFYERCYITLSSKWPLQQSRKRKEKENAENSPTIPEQQDLQEKECKTSSSKRWRCSIGGPIYQNNKMRLVYEKI